MRYQLVIGEDDKELENKVNQLITYGWIPQGGVHVYPLQLNYPDRIHFLQAMVSDPDYEYDPTKGDEERRKAQKRE